MPTDDKLLERVMNMSDAEIEAELERLGIDTQRMMDRIRPAIREAERRYKHRRAQRRALYFLGASTVVSVLLIYLSNR